MNVMSVVALVQYMNVVVKNYLMVVVLQMIAKMETGEETCKRPEIVAARVVTVGEAVLCMAMRAKGAEIEELHGPGIHFVLGFL